jgi:hypothetical protein
VAENGKLKPNLCKRLPSLKDFILELLEPHKSPVFLVILLCKNLNKLRRQDL